ncbi:MAG: hypothetical protein WCH00_00210 [Candidatus Saccharibacteria bacterium]
MNTQRQKVMLGAAALLLLLLTFGFAIVVSQNHSKASAAPVSNCASDVHFYAYDVTENFFGPASASNDVNAQKTEFFHRLCTDPALMVATSEYLAGSYTTPSDRTSKVDKLMTDRKSWRDSEALTQLSLSSCQSSIQSMSGSYQTLWMQKGSSSNDVPGIYQASPERPQYFVLRFDCTGKQFNFKLDCGFQPVAMQFPGIPTTPPSVPSVAPTTSPSGCPTGYHCKDPNQGIDHNPGACSLGDCGPRPVNPTPPPADTTKPKATVVPPSTTLPAPTPLPVPQPPVTTPIVDPVTAPS